MATKKADLIQKLTDLQKGDPEENHIRADALLLDYIGDQAVREAFEGIPRWYA